MWSNFISWTGLTILDLSAYIGLVAVGAVTVNVLLGMLMAFRYSPVRSWPHRRINYFQLHNWSGYIALSVSILHPIVLLFYKAKPFRVLDIVYPVHSPSQPLDNTIGAVALYMVLFVVITSYFRVRLGRRLWKAFHLTIYLAAGALFWHSIFTDPDLKNAPVDWFDGGKIFIEVCLIIIVVMSFLRSRYYLRKTKHAREMSVEVKASL
jgi:methionine sulfoxide reductase heme-binding subunit